MLPKSIKRTIEAFADLPGIGSRSAERLVFMLLKNQQGLDLKMAEALFNLKKCIKECSVCHHFCEEDRCPLCTNLLRDHRTICVVETPLDLVALERTHEFKGGYHILHGVISPLNKIGPNQLRIQTLFDRIHHSERINEIILALSGSIEGQATALYIAGQLKSSFSGKITRLSRGIPTGGDLDYLDIGTLTQAILERKEI